MRKTQKQAAQERMAEVMRQSRIVGKIRKLQALGNDPMATEAERETAWKLAREMMKKHADIFEGR